MKWLPGLTGDINRLKMDRSWCGTYSGSYGSQGTRTSEIAKCKRCWSLLAPGAQWGHIVHRAARCIWHWYEVASRAFGTLHVWKWIDLDVVHVVAPMAHMGPGTSDIGKCKGRWSLVSPGAQWGHIVHRLARCIRHWYEVAPRAQWAHKTSENG